MTKVYIVIYCITVAAAIHYKTGQMQVRSFYSMPQAKDFCKSYGIDSSFTCLKFDSIYVNIDKQHAEQTSELQKLIYQNNQAAEK